MRDALALRGAVLAHRADSDQVLVIVPLSGPLPRAYTVLADREVLLGYVGEFGSPTAAAEQLSAELAAETAGARVTVGAR